MKGSNLTVWLIALSALAIACPTLIYLHAYNLLADRSREAAIEKECEDVRIIRIGGCDSTGLCGVKSIGGQKYMMRYPVVGETVRVCKEP